METYKEQCAQQSSFAQWADKNFDNWLVAPIAQTRDSGLLSESNWAVFTAELESKYGPESSDGATGSGSWAILRFNHWACGWLEIILVRPRTGAAEYAAECEYRLERYPVLDESDWSDREYQASVQNTGEAMHYLGYSDKRACEVLNWIADSEDYSSEAEPKDDGGAWPDDDAILAAAKALRLRRVRVA